MAMIFSLLFALAVAWFLFVPLLDQNGSGEARFSTSPEIDSLSDQKERCLQVLKDLELDYATNKISQDDYERTKGRLAAELAEIIERAS